MIYVLGSGTPLNYKVVGGTSAPSNPVGNTIWINTSNAITFYTFQPLTPSNPQEGWVWIDVAPSYSPVAFNALKENRIQLYPISAKQYISGAWVDKTAKSYQGGEWVDWWNGQLYDNGNQYTEVTGGFGAYAHGNNGAGSNRTTPTVAFNTGSITLSFPASSGYKVGMLWVEDAIDVTRFSKLKITVSARSLSKGGDIGMNLSKTKADNFVQVATKLLTSTGTFELDISSLSGSHYINVGMGGIDGSASITFTKFWLE